MRCFVSVRYFNKFLFLIFIPHSTKKKLREEKRNFDDFKMTACYNNQYFIALLIQVQGSLKTSGSNFQSIVFHHTKKILQSCVEAPFKSAESSI